jgi:hypothetical protein
MMTKFLDFAKGFSGAGFALALVLSSMTPGAAAQGPAAANQQSSQITARPDAEVQTDVVAAITASPILNVQPIAAVTAGGQVTLSGSVDDTASKELAEMLVSKVSGVRSVVNNLEVVPIGAPSAGEPANGSAAEGQRLPQQPEQPTVAEQAPSAEAYPSESASPRPPYDDRAPASQGQYPAPQGQYPAPQEQYPAPQGQYPTPPARYPNSRPVQSGPVQIPQGILLTVRLSESLDTRTAGQGAMFQVTSARDIYAGSVLAIPRGAVLEGQIVEVRSVKGSLGGNSSLSLQLNTLVLEGRTYPIGTDIWVGNGPGKGAYSAANTITGATIGAVIGGIAGGGSGAAIGGTLGGATGAAASSASSGPRVILPPETMLSFHLTSAITVQPVSYQEAQRLASASRPSGGPYLGRRRMYPPPAAVYPYPYGYPYAYAYPRAYPYGYGYPRYRVYRGW